MYDCGAPAWRGFRDAKWIVPAGLSGLLAILFLAIASSPGRVEANQRRLQAAPPVANPGFSLPSLDGSQYELQRHAGRIVLIHFFATWCEPCREELASLSRLVARQGAAPPLSVVAVNVAEVSARVKRFLEAAPVNFPVLLDADRAETKSWGVSVLPSTFVLDRTLVPRLFVEGDLDWTRMDVLEALEQVRAAETE
jgi:thiol-disulfide isomerase/thioredoxin